MKDFLTNLVKDKNILILGFGREGQSSYKLLRKHFPDLKLTIADSSPLGEASSLRLSDKNLNFILGEDYLKNLSGFNMIIKTPGIPLHKLPKNIPPVYITSQTDFFLHLFSKQIIGITGTKGKSTTASLIYHIIKLHTYDVVLVGNIGIPPFSLIDEIGENTKIVYELSCHQLNDVTVSPHISVLLNIYREHLDYYRHFEEYQLAKYNITRYQKPDDYFIYHKEDENTRILINTFQQKVNYYPYSLNNKSDKGCYIENNKIIFASENHKHEVYNLSNERHLIGEHNILNIMAAVNACKLLEIPDEIIIKGINTFKGLKHRLEYIGEIDNVHYYNDSIATIPEATIEAVKALKNVNTLILGGFDRGLDYSGLINFILTSSVQNLIFLGPAGERMYKQLNELKTTNYELRTTNYELLVKDLSEAVSIAKTKTAKGTICLLSPAAASYDMFKDFEDRGDTFRKLVLNQPHLE